MSAVGLPTPESGGSAQRWRFTVPADAPFLYDLVLQLDPRIWRVSHNGTTPMGALDAFAEYSASVTVLDDAGAPCGFAGLVNLSGTIRCAQLDIHALPNDAAEERVRSVAAEIVGAAFDGSPVEQLFTDIFVGDTDLLAEVECFRDEVVLPEFTRIEDQLVTRVTRGTSRSEFEEWRAAR